MGYIAINLQVLDEQKELISAELDAMGAEGIWDKGTELQAYMPEDLFDRKTLYDMLSHYKLENSFTTEKLEDQNWNALWEANYDPIQIRNEVLVRASFHESVPNIQYEIIIDPRMSFGTGHHETTRLCMELMLGMDMKNKNILDMGCGTGILTFLAKQQGADTVIGIDIEENAVENAIDNMKYNESEGVSFLMGSSDAIPSTQFHVVLSNITKNINKGLLPYLAERLLNGGQMVLAGFLNFDLEEMVQECRKLNLKLIRNIHEGDWEAIIVEKV
jgi:ribosomal protein L11 methyltransferase